MPEHVVQQSSLREGHPVTDADGDRAHVVALDHDGPEPTALLQADGGAIVRVPVGLLTRGEDGGLRLAFSLTLLENEIPAAVDATAHGAAADARTATIPVVQESLEVGKRLVDAGRGVRVRKTVSAREEVVDPLLLHDELVVERVAIGRTVPRDDPPVARQEGDTWIVPVLEEVLVVDRQLRLKEEVRITRHQRESHAPQTVTLRTEQVAVERFEDGRRQRSGEAAP